MDTEILESCRDSFDCLYTFGVFLFLFNKISQDAANTAQKLTLIFYLFYNVQCKWSQTEVLHTLSRTTEKKKDISSQHAFDFISLSCSYVPFPKGVSADIRQTICLRAL